MSDTVRNAEDQSMHRTAALHFAEYLETPPSTNGSPWCLCCRCTGTDYSVSVAALGLPLISIPRLHATSLGTRTGFFLDKAPSVQDSGQDKEFRDCSETVPGHLATMQCDACSVTNKMYSVTLHYNASHCMQHTSSQYITLYATHHTVCNMCCLARSWGIMLEHLIVG